MNFTREQVTREQVTREQGLKSTNWSAVLVFILGFWLSGSLIIDLVVIPCLARAGMMSQAEFASAGYLIFGAFNRVELLCAALVVTGVLMLRQGHWFSRLQEGAALILSVVLLSVTLVSTYVLTPQMSGMGMQLDLFAANEPMSLTMMEMHGAYWALETFKAIAGLTLLAWCFRLTGLDLRKSF